jgi:arginyl-tRNA synthetase
MKIKQILHEQIKSAVQDLDLEFPDFDLSHPPTVTMGDYSTNVALLGAKQAGKSPRELAEEIAEMLRAKSKEYREIEKIEIAGPGFINFILTSDYFIGVLRNIVSEDYNLSLSTTITGKKVMMEFTDANPFKELHIGHLYSNTVGESISRLFEAAGAEVKRANYQGDVGLHVAKAVWGMKRKLDDENKSLADFALATLQDRVKWLGEAYALGAAAYEEDGIAKDEITQINKQIYEEDPEVSELYTTGRQWSLDYFEIIYARLGTKFDYYYFESKAGTLGRELVREYLNKGVFKESQGAIIFPGEEHGLHTRVFINSLGLPTYEAKELGLALTKYQDYSFDISISVTANEINEYFKVLFKALSFIRPEIAEKTRHISHGMVKLPEGKMSSRTGNILTGEWLLNEAKERLKKSYPEMAEETLEMVAVGAVKWALLRSGIGKDISFNIDESVSFEGDSGPYIQYTYARTQSVLAKSIGQSAEGKQTSSFWEVPPQSGKYSWVTAISPKSLAEEEIKLLKLFDRFTEVVEEAGKHYSPNLVTNYLFDLAKTFNHFYQKQRILDPVSTTVIASETKQSDKSVILSDARPHEVDSPSWEESHEENRRDSSPTVQNDNIRSFRLALTQATANVLRSGLHLLGIKAPEKM